uniref:Uncharacterized protein n=1 Tax=Arundo donax TaxID=35708 RepID=A0A0A9G8D4_ARUDO
MGIEEGGKKARWTRKKKARESRRKRRRSRLMAVMRVHQFILVT